MTESFLNKYFVTEVKQIKNIFMHLFCYLEAGTKRRAVMKSLISKFCPVSEVCFCVNFSRLIILKHGTLSGLFVGSLLESKTNTEALDKGFVLSLLAPSAKSLADLEQLFLDDSSGNSVQDRCSKDDDFNQYLKLHLSKAKKQGEFCDVFSRNFHS